MTTASLASALGGALIASRILASRSGAADSHEMMTESLDKPALLTAATLCQAALHSSEVGEGRLKEPMPIPHPRQGITCGPADWLIMSAAEGATTPWPGPPRPNPSRVVPGDSTGWMYVAAFVVERSLDRFAHGESLSILRASDSLNSEGGLLV